MNAQDKNVFWSVWEVEYTFDASGESDIVLIEFVKKFNAWKEANEYAMSLNTFDKKFKAFQS